MAGPGGPAGPRPRPRPQPPAGGATAGPPAARATAPDPAHAGDRHATHDATHAAHQAAASAARHAYGRLVAWLAWQWHDLAAAEDALSAAFISALTHWPQDGVPARPEAWLLTAARRELLHSHRHQRLVQSPLVQVLLQADPDTAEAPSVQDTLPDRRLALMCTCAHPALAAALHAPLMLQAVLGLDAKAIARAFLVAPAAMAQRLVRAKAKIRDAGLRFEVPGPEDLPARAAAVLEGIYGAYTIGSDVAGAPEAEPALREEALFLAQLMVQLQPQNAEALGLLALLLHAEARRPAQYDAAQNFVPLTQQDTRLWQRGLMQQAEAALWRAAALRQPGPLQLEAAIQSAHNQRAHGGATPWPQIARLYAALVALHGSIGARLGQAVAVAEAGDPGAALALLNAVPTAQIAAHQPYWVARAHLLRLAGQTVAAAQARQRAAGLTADERVRRFLLAPPD